MRRSIPFLIPTIQVKLRSLIQKSWLYPRALKLKHKGAFNNPKISQRLILLKFCLKFSKITFNFSTPANNSTKASRSLSPTSSISRKAVLIYEARLLLFLYYIVLLSFKRQRRKKNTENSSFQSNYVVIKLLVNKIESHFSCQSFSSTIGQIWSATNWSNLD